MRRFLQRFPSLCARNFLQSPTVFRRSNTSPCVVRSIDRVTSRFVFFSSESDSARGSISDEVVSKEELKKRIQSFLDEGDDDALPDLFEAMMNRKLSGKHDESDYEVMEVVRKYPVNDAHKVHDTDSDIDGDSSDSEIESDDGLRDGDSSDSQIGGLEDVVDLSDDLDIKIDGLKDGDLSNIGIKIDRLKADHSSYSDSESD